MFQPGSADFLRPLEHIQKVVGADVCVVGRWLGTPVKILHLLQRPETAAKGTLNALEVMSVALLGVMAYEDRLAEWKATRQIMGALDGGMHPLVGVLSTVLHPLVLVAHSLLVDGRSGGAVRNPG